MSKITDNKSIKDDARETIDYIAKFYNSLIKSIFLVSRNNPNMSVLEYLVFHRPKTFRQIAISTRLSYNKLNESLAELKRAELILENVFSLSENKIMKIYDVRADIKSALYKALSLDTD